MAVRRRAVLRAGALAAAGGGAALALDGSVRGTADDDVEALVAGSLARLAGDVPGASVEAHGSLTVRRMVRNGVREPDAVALADPALFAGIRERVRVFATNALVVACHDGSQHRDGIHRDWASALARPDVSVGRTDPEKDPLGYRTVLALRLAERRGIASTDLLDGTRVFPETALPAHVASGKLDAAFLYRNMAADHDLPAVDLPATIDFSDPARAETYASVSMALKNRTVRGGPIRYGAAALTPRGREWVDDLVGDADRLRAYGFSVPEAYPTVRRIQ